MDGRGRDRRPGVRAVARSARTPPRQALEEIGDVACLGVERGQFALLQEAPELQQVRAVRIEGVTRQPALKLQVGEEVEHEVLEATLDDGLLDGGHGAGFARAVRSPPRCNAAVRRAASAGQERSQPQQPHERLRVATVPDRAVELGQRLLDDLDALVLVRIGRLVVEVGGHEQVALLIGEAG
jgi:hypothetical protein